MKPEHVASVICKYIVNRKRTYKPWWLLPGEFASIAFRNLWEIFTTKYFEKKQHAEHI